MSEPSILDARLAEIDRRLRTIQSGLAPVPDDAASEIDSAPLDAGEIDGWEPGEESGEIPQPPEPLRLVEAVEDHPDRLAELVEAHERLLELHRELLSQYAEVLERRAGEGATVAITAGPFETSGDVRDFERALAALPNVRAVTVREYLGEDRVQVDVRLADG